MPDIVAPGGVLVGVDGSPSAVQAVRWGAAEAARREVPLRLVIAFDWPHNVLWRPDGHEVRYRDRLLATARDHLATAARAAAQDEPGLQVEQQLIVGAPIPVLAEESRRAQVLVLGDRGLGPVEGLLVGSVAAALAPHGPCPVVVVRGIEGPSAATVSLPVVVGVDEHSDAAVTFAFEAAAARRVSVVAVHSWWQPAFEPEMASVLFDRGPIQAEEQRLLAQRMTGWTHKFPGVFVEYRVTGDSPARILLDQARAAQLVVVGSRGRGGFASLVLGSVGHALLQRSPCPVAVVRPETTG